MALLFLALLAFVPAAGFWAALTALAALIGESFRGTSARDSVVSLTLPEDPSSLSCGPEDSVTPFLRCRYRRK